MNGHNRYKESISQAARNKSIEKVTVAGAIVNVILAAGKILCGIFGRSAAMISDGIHSFSDLLSDAIVLIFAKISSKEEDADHQYGHGKFETLASVLVSILLFFVGIEILVSGVKSIIFVAQGGTLPSPAWIALAAAVVSVVSKEILYQVTAKVGKDIESQAVIANAWHHRSDALSSVAAFLGIGGAMLLGGKWAILDPIVSCIISIAILYIAIKMVIPATKELLDVSLPAQQEAEIIDTAASVAGVKNVHHLKTRRSGSAILVDFHIVVDPQLSVEKAHDIATGVEDVLIDKFGSKTQVSIHIEPDENSL